MHIRTDRYIVADLAIVSINKLRRHPIADRHILQSTVGTDRAVRADFGIALDPSKGINHGVASDLNVAVDKSTRRIHERDAVRHQLIIFAATENFFCDCQLLTRIDPKRLGKIFGCDGTYFIAAEFDDLKHIGQIIFALSVVIRDRFERFEQGFNVETINAGIDFANFFLLIVGVLLFDNPFNRTVLRADYPTVTGGIGHYRG